MATYPNGKKTYAELTKPERWVWHSEVYAWRHITLDAPISAGSSPLDPNGEWFNPKMIEGAVDKLLEKRHRVKRERAAVRDVEEQRKGRDIVNKWAQARGFLDLDDYCERTDIPWVDAYTEIIEEICATTPHKDGILFPPRIGNFRSLADCIGGGRTRGAA